ncbi:hypothetical protein BaRGS_00007166 [Batillaria attramentaria]|uniref:Uncharacterized protein n=1 Tax=Batillaria attramentaria TaxID=370345 RepID=A0ABD0LR66_9CAEN
MNRGAKRGLFQSPFSSAKKDQSKAKKARDLMDAAEVAGDDATGGLREGEKNERGKLQFDVAAIHETVLSRVNDTLSGFKGKDKSGDFDNPLIRQLIPALATAVSVAVGEVMRGIVRDLDERFSQPERVTNDKLLASVTRLTYENDLLQQYTRRESVRVYGIKQDEDETEEQVERKVMDIFTKCGVDVKLDDTAAIHRVGKLKNGSRPVLVKFMSRRKRREVMEKKKQLKGEEGCERIYINDDLTPLRARLLGYVQRLDGVERAWTVDGRVYCLKKLPEGHAATSGGQRKPIVIETPDDLFDRLDVESVDFVSLGLSHLVADN